MNRHAEANGEGDDKIRDSHNYNFNFRQIYVFIQNQRMNFIPILKRRDIFIFFVYLTEPIKSSVSWT